MANADAPINCYLCEKAHDALIKTTYEPWPLGPHDCEVKITHCGICHTDVHLIDNDWKVTMFPLVAGHEIIGIVESVGSDVENIKVGQRVGIGYIRRACLECEYCLSGRDNLCVNSELTCNGNHGGFANRIRLNSGWAHVIPEAIPSEFAAPLMCAGTTMYAPLRRYVNHPMTKVGIVGVGGLGVLGIKFARAMGAEVWAFSTSGNSKKEIALKSGAHHFVDVSDPAQEKKAKMSVDLLLSTSPVALDWPKYFNFLKADGKLCLVGIQEGNVSVPILDMIFNQRSVVSTTDGTRNEVKEMLQFAAQNQIFPEIQLFEFSQINECIERMRKEKVGYRMVLKAPDSWS
eukprot:TRINITY_DN8223_c0_g1_i1.p1 TRINITY_DN8223_c0_g1~~TRINITY_DN8223_c0_g1_i1.p1  ORF type:complete len:346 (+),score=54.69 TRINITY_DN8223_c0_g1_i1:123-1160(+)